MAGTNPTTEATNTEESQRNGRFLDAMNRQGHPFQNRVLAEAVRLHEIGESSWSFEAAEFPVEVDQGTKIDFILSDRRRLHWMLAECKRVNPAYSDWLFLRTPFVRRNHTEQFIVDTVERAPWGAVTASSVSLSFPARSQVAHLGFDVKAGKPGDPTGGSSRSAIEEAASQVCRGMNGLVKFASGHAAALGPTKSRRLLPVIFTTARLFLGEADFRRIDLNSGEVKPEQFDAKEVQFVYYQYHLSPGIKHDVGPKRTAEDLAQILAIHYIRTIAVVSATGMAYFLKTHDPELFSASPIDG